MAYCPFDNVPPEILSHILTLAWLSVGTDTSLRRFRFPSIPSLVNRNFNRTTIATPILWTTIRANDVSDLPHIEDRILRKSGALPLDMYLIFDGIAYHDARIMVERTILLSPSRCRTIILSYLHPFILEPPLYANPWDHLQPLMTLNPPLQATSLSIFTENAHTIRLGSLPLIASLRSLTLSNCNFVWSPAFFPGSLEVLSVDETETVDAMELYRCLNSPIHRSLRSLSFSGFIVEYGEILGTHILERLEYFKLEGFYLDEAAVLLSIIQAPNLRHLSLIRIFYSSLPQELATLWKALTFPHLYRLKLQEFEVVTERMVDFFASLQNSVKSLEIGGDNIRSLHMHPSTDALYSHLLEIHAYDVPLSTLVALVDGRCPSLRTLEARFKRVSDIDQGLTRENIAAHFGVLERLVPDFKVLRKQKIQKSMNQLAWTWDRCLHRLRVSDSMAGAVGVSRVD